MDEASVLELLSGKRSGVLPTVLRGVLRTVSWGYQLGSSLRNLAFDYGWKKTHRAAVPVISIGNLTTGGTGKTPLVAWVVNTLQKARAGGDPLQPAILSRGYRSLDDQENDEKRVLDQLCPGVPHVQNPDRVTGAATAVEQFAAEVIVLDDGFQHRRLHRDVNLLLIDATRPWGYGYLLPRGLLRESRRGLRRADAILITRADQISESALETLRAELHDLASATPVFEVCFPPVQFRAHNGGTVPLTLPDNSRAGLFCGIGNPDGFFRTVEKLGLAISTTESYPDHHHYSDDDLGELARLAETHQLTHWITTGKDLVKIPRNTLGPADLYALEIGVKFRSNEEPLQELLSDRIRNR